MNPDYHGPSELLGFRFRFVPASGPSTRTLLLLHGTGGDENDLLGLGQTIAPEAAMLSPRGRVLEHGMPRFFRRLAEGVFDEEDLLHRTDELAAFVQAACTQQRRDPRHVIAVGFSNGANIAAAMLLKRPEILEAAVLIRAMVPFEPPSLPRLPGTPVLMLSARNDPIVSPTNTLRLADLLKSAGAALSLQWNAGGHGLSGDDVDSARRWLVPLLAVETPQKVSMDRGRT